MADAFSLRGHTPRIRTAAVRHWILGAAPLSPRIRNPRGPQSALALALALAARVPLMYAGTL